jgi:hypothetical protein
MPKPAGGVSSILVVVAPSFSVGTARVKYWSVFALATAGLIEACPKAAGAAASAAAATAATTSFLIGWAVPSGHGGP